MRRRFPALLGVLLLGCGMLSGCANSSSENETVEMEDMPYGSTLSVRTDLAVPMQYDKRYLDDELVEKVAKFHHAIQEVDAEEFAALILPMFEEYELETVNEGKATEQELLQSAHDSFSTFLNGDFDFSLLDVTEVTKEDVLSGTRDTMQKMLDDLASDNGQEPFSNNTDRFVEMKIIRYLTPKGSEVGSETDYALPEETLYGMHYQGEWYLIYV